MLTEALAHELHDSARTMLVSGTSHVDLGDEVYIEAVSATLAVEWLILLGLLVGEEEPHMLAWAMAQARMAQGRWFWRAVAMTAAMEVAVAMAVVAMAAAVAMAVAVALAVVAMAAAVAVAVALAVVAMAGAVAVTQARRHLRVRRPLPAWLQEPLHVVLNQVESTLPPPTPSRGRVAARNNSVH